MLQTGDLEIPLRRAAAAGAPLGDISLTKTAFRDLEGTIRFFEKSGLGIPDSFLDSLRAVIVVSEECDFVPGGNSLTDSLDSFRSRVCNAEDHIVGPSQGRDGMPDFLHQLLGVSRSSPPLAVGPNSLRLDDGVGSLGVSV